jgi:hypothetical protein
VNGFFMSTPDSAFIKELVAQTLTYNLDDQPKNHVTIESSFGPTRYNEVLLSLLGRAAARSRAAEGLPGCSILDLGTEDIYLTHEAAIATVKPPFSLGYKSTDDYWKWFSIPD